MSFFAAGIPLFLLREVHRLVDLILSNWVGVKDAVEYVVAFW